MNSKEMVLSVLGGELFMFENFQHSFTELWTKDSKIIVLPWALYENERMSPRKIEYEQWVSDMDNMQFYYLFRMEKYTFHNLINVLGRADSTRLFRRPYRGGHYPIELKLQALILLWYMATQDSLIYIANRFGVTHTSVMNIVNRLLYFMLKLKKEYIKFPQTLEELQVVAQGFQHYPGVVGALDGTHVFVKVEQEQQDSYIDRYRRHSINIMAICESNGMFTYVFIGFPGSAHDSRVFEHSAFFRRIEMHGPNSVFFDDTRYHLIGDGAFGLKSWLMTPYKDNNNLTRVERHHNYCLSADRVKIEHSFGQLKGRWRRLVYINTYNIGKTIEIATAACVLHNFCLINNSLWTGEQIFQGPINIAVPAEIQQAGRLKMDRIANELYYNP